MNTHTANTDRPRPHLECPNCGKTVLTLREWGITSRVPIIYTCSYCQCKYRIPLKCQNIKDGVIIGFALICGLFYIKIRLWIFELLSLGDISQKVADAVGILFPVLGLKLAGQIGKKMAYKYPLEKVD